MKFLNRGVLRNGVVSGGIWLVGILGNGGIEM